jgi:undecaprenyl diphosphate synthase
MVAPAPDAPQQQACPAHVAVIMDGNGRWARRRALPRQAGHQAGVRPVRAMVEECAERGVEILTLFAFSTENWLRPAEEVGCLMTLFVDALNREVAELDANGIRLKFVGDLSQLNKRLQDAITAAELRTRNNQRMQLVIAVAYGGQWDIAQAARSLAAEVAAGQVDIDSIDESSIQARLKTAALPPVDLLIRTGGEKRISNFLLWQLAYSEIYFTDILWPDFTITELHRALDFYGQRERRFGRTGEQVGAASC